MEAIDEQSILTSVLMGDLERLPYITHSLLQACHKRMQEHHKQKIRVSLHDPKYKQVKELYERLKNKPEVLYAIREQKKKKKFARDRWKGKKQAK